MRQTVSEDVRAAAALALLMGAAFALACRLVEFRDTLGPGGDRTLARLLGSTRRVAGEHLVEKADQYFHMGVPSRPKRFRRDVFQRWHDAVSPRAHRHTEGEEVREIMPWLRWATAVDPGNLEAFLTAAYWLAGPGRRPDLAERILREAQRHHPRDYRVYAELGRLRLLLREKERAAQTLDVALDLWPSGRDPTDEDVRADLGRLVAYRAFLYEVDGQEERALELFRRASEIFPENVALRQRAEALERGESSREWARERWEGLFAQRACARHEASAPATEVHGPARGHEEHEETH